MIRIFKRSCFTLLELLIVLFILSFGVILTGVKIKEVYTEQRFLSEAQQVLSHLAMAQDLMLILDADVQVKFSQDPRTKTLTYWIEIEKPLEETWSRLVERKMQLSAIRSYQFTDTKEDHLTLHFTLGQMSKGTLSLYEGAADDSHRSEKRQLKIELVGYPSPLGIASKPIKERDKTAQSQLLYPSEVYEKLYSDPNKNS